MKELIREYLSIHFFKHSVNYLGYSIVHIEKQEGLWASKFNLNKRLYYDELLILRL